MIGTTLRTVLALTTLGITAVVLASTPANAQSQNMEVIHHPNYDKNVFMPFVPAIKIKSGKLLLACRHHRAARLSRPSAQA